jgi:hypothetical protein
VDTEFCIPAAICRCEACLKRESIRWTISYTCMAVGSWVVRNELPWILKAQVVGATLIFEAAVEDPEAATNYRLWIDLICKPQPWREIVKLAR